MEHLKQIAGTSLPSMGWKSKWEIHLSMVETKSDKILRDSQIQTDKPLGTHQDIVVVEKLQKEAVAIDLPEA